MCKIMRKCSWASDTFREIITCGTKYKHDYRLIWLKRT